MAKSSLAKDQDSAASRDIEVNPRIGLLGELLVEQQLAERGWHPVRLDTSQMAANADLLALKRSQRVALQVKTTNREKQSKNSGWLQFGYASGFLAGANSIFNSKESPLLADVVVSVLYRKGEHRFIVLPVAFVEALCAFHCKFWYALKTRAGIQRKPTFPIWLPITAEREPNAKHWKRIKAHLLGFENRWDVLDRSISDLHNPKKWPRP